MPTLTNHIVLRPHGHRPLPSDLRSLIVQPALRRTKIAHRVKPPRRALPRAILTVEIIAHHIAGLVVPLLTLPPFLAALLSGHPGSCALHSFTLFILLHSSSNPVPRRLLCTLFALRQLPLTILLVFAHLASSSPDKLRLRCQATTCCFSHSLACLCLPSSWSEPVLVCKGTPCRLPWA